LAPASSTSIVWESRWPIKPEIVLEGANAAVSPDKKQVDAVDDLSLLSTHWKPLEKLFAPTGDTSAAAAQAARMAAIIQAGYPGLWPETVRALLVHSAMWSDAMLDEYPLGTSEADRLRLRSYGYGVPDLNQALWSLKNDVTLIVQSELQPFEKSKDRIRMKEMHLHRLPWPIEVLAGLGSVPVTIHVTLSYFVEPNPARRGWRYRHIYPSHGLRFKMKHPTEPLDAFRERVNKAAREEGEEMTTGARITGSRSRWRLGERARDKGSISSDVWEGTAAEAAECGVLAVFPITGWWRERPRLGRAEERARYSLVVSIQSPTAEVDIYAAVATKVAVPIAIRTP
jgi:hypothetical protein